MSGLQKNQSNRPIFLANNWDRFGGRALDIFNGYVLSKKLNCDFAFYWPEDHRFPEMEEQVNFFSQSFREKYRIYQCPSSEEIQHIDFNSLELNDAQQAISNLTKGHYFKNPDFMSLPKFSDEDEDSARFKYAEISKSIVSSSILSLWNELKKNYSMSDAVHGRYGDLVTGSFNQYVDTGKYIDSLSLKVLLEKITKEKNEILILSDSPQISHALERLINVKLLPKETDEMNAKKLTYFELQTIELLIMASCKNIFAAGSSAYSILASRIGNVPLKFIRHELVDTSISMLLPLNRRKYYSKFNRKIRSEVRSRDLMSILQFYWRDFDFEFVSDLISDANNSDRHYVLSLCLEAIIARIEGKSKKAIKKINKAETLARSRIDIHDDPLMLTLLVKYFLQIRESSEEASNTKWKILALNPYQFSKHDAVMFILDYESEKAENKLELRDIPLEDSWNEITQSDEKEIVYALLKLLIKKESTSILPQ